MKQSMSTTSIFQLVLGFTLLFTAFLAVAITYNRVIRLKNETIAIIERYEGVSNKSISIINNYLKEGGYNILDNCEDGEYGVYDLTKDSYELSQPNKKYYYCLYYFCEADSCKINDPKTPNGNHIYYKIKLFFKFNIPFIGELMTFKINGDTKGIKLYQESQKLS